LFLGIWVLVEIFTPVAKAGTLKNIGQRLKFFFVDKIGWGHSQRGRKWLVVLVTLLGMVAGILTHPYFPDNLKFYHEQVIKIAFLNIDYTSLNVGSEWFPFPPLSLLSSASLLFIVLAVSLVFVAWTPRRLSKVTVYLGIMTVVLLLLTLKTRRFVEYLVPITIMFTSLLWRDLLGELRWRDIWRRYLSDTWLHKTMTIVVIVAGLFIIGRSIWFTKQASDEGRPLTQYREAALWMKYNLPDNALVINNNWSDWPQLFYYNTTQNYLIGLDMRFMLNKYPYAIDTYLALNKAEERPEINPYIFFRQRLNGDYLFISKQRGHLREKISDSVYFQIVYEDDDAAIYRIQ
ncbi:MAG: hypothetical protein NUV82_03430, partial [Candidatus Komeilibacteria bacterium]|nr:hypothetical protein [Candidatus Komeilibacteria bacterium]